MNLSHTHQRPARGSSDTAATRPRSGLRDILSVLLHTLLPSICLCCGAKSSVDLKSLCEFCAASFLERTTLTGEDKSDIKRHAGYSRCVRCGLTLPGITDADQQIIRQNLQCGQCLSDPPSFDDSVVAAHYAPPLDRLIQDLKFRSRLPLAQAFGVLLARSAVTASGIPSASRLATADLILPVPLSSARLAERGFNQAMEIARPVARAMQLPLAGDLCLRVRDTCAQAGLPLSQRRVNMRGAFAVRQRSAIEGRHIVVIDDVMTTGQTLNELAACLKRHGAARVSNLVLARTPMR